MVAHAEERTQEEIESRTKFISLSSWLDYMKDCTEWFLSHPLIEAVTGQGATEPTQETTEVLPSQAKYNTFVSSIGKRKIIYHPSADVSMEELLVLSIKCDVNSKKMETVLTRSGLGATTRVYYTDERQNFVPYVDFSDNFISYRLEQVYYHSNDNASGNIGQCKIKMIAQTLNEIPTYEANNQSTVFSHSNYHVIGGSSGWAEYAENTFSTNNPTYYSNHTIITQNSFSVCSVEMPIQSNTYVNENNINNYSNYGLVVGAGGVVSLDPDIFAGYFNGTLKPQLELVYRNAYTDFPDIGANFSDDDIIYINPFPHDEQEPTGDTSGQIQPFSIDYDEILSERELESILRESQYILDTTPYEIESSALEQAVSEPYAVLKQNSKLSSEVAGDIAKVYSITDYVFSSPALTDVMKIYGFIAFLSVGMWFVLRK